jgi:hypothetical protein
MILGCPMCDAPFDLDVTFTTDDEGHVEAVVSDDDDMVVRAHVEGCRTDPALRVRRRTEALRRAREAEGQ